jgi:hypothetical protein
MGRRSHSSTRATISGFAWYSSIVTRVAQDSARKRVLVLPYGPDLAALDLRSGIRRPFVVQAAQPSGARPWTTIGVPGSWTWIDADEMRATSSKTNAVPRPSLPLRLNNSTRTN